MIEYFENLLRSMGFQDADREKIISDVSGFVALEVFLMAGLRLDGAAKKGLAEQMQKLGKGAHPTEALEFLRTYFPDSEIQVMLESAFPRVFNRYLALGAESLSSRQWSGLGAFAAGQVAG
ncbi:MAG TPA: hypothetical protein VFM02_01870 [Candidatus Paceibacterota bacterium]|nr:hypothetical protein [Candidatus Paceibacterota bacterium]